MHDTNPTQRNLTPQAAERDPLLQRTLRAVEAVLGQGQGLSPAALGEAEGRMAVLLAAYPALGEEGEEVQG